MMPAARRSIRRVRGFTLAELAIAFLVMSLILGGLLATLSAQNTSRQLAETQRTLENAREALIGFAVRFGRLPCPAVDGATGVEVRRPAVNAFTCSVCANADPFCEGMLPALTLGIGPTDREGYLVDSWGNRVRYAVTNWSKDGTVEASCPPAGTDYKRCPAFTTANAIASLGFANQPPLVYPNLLRVCDGPACGGVTFTVPAVIWSPGRNFLEKIGPPAAYGADETENVDTFIPAPVPSDGTLVMHEPRPAGAGGGEFDDIVTWISPSVLYSRLVSAGAL